MASYIFPYSCDEFSDELEMNISKKDVELIKEAYRNGFETLSDSDDLEKLQKKALKQLDFYEPDLDQDIRVYFPEEITEEVDEE